MNERIVKLITEADAYAWTIAEKYVPECGEVNYLWEDAFRKKFAELIVQECGQWWTNRLVVEPDYGLPHRIERNRAVPGVIKEFNAHFGVEQ